MFEEITERVIKKQLQKEADLQKLDQLIHEKQHQLFNAESEKEDLIRRGENAQIYDCVAVAHNLRQIISELEAEREKVDQSRLFTLQEYNAFRDEVTEEYAGDESSAQGELVDALLTIGRVFKKLKADRNEADKLLRSIYQKTGRAINLSVANGIDKALKGSVFELSRKIYQESCRYDFVKADLGSEK